jgi:hypothetical protein
MHAPQDAVAAGLQRRVHVAGDARRGSHEAQQLVGEIHRLDGTEAQPLDSGLIEQAADKVRQAHAAPWLAAPAAQVDATQDYFAIAAAEAAHLLDHLVRRRAAAAPPDERNDAERAAVIAAVLDLQVGARAVAGGVLHRRGEEVVLREDIADEDVAVIGRGADQFGDLRLVGIPHDPFHAGHGGQFIGRALCVATGHQDAGRGVLAMHAAERSGARLHRRPG